MPNIQPIPRLEALEPASVWRIFAGISAVPRPSGKEEKIRAHILAWAKGQDLPAREDSAGNILISVPATPGHEGAPVITLQGHMDMVCEKNSGTRHDFEKDPIRLVVDRVPETEELVVRAEGTTLGADNGIGLALGMAAAISPEMVHGPLEILCTVDEEVGLNGAQQLPKGFFSGRLLLNLDSEADDTLTIGCAGGCDTTLSWEFDCLPLPADAEICTLQVRGLRGGHSGADIHKNLANANCLLVQTLLSAPGVRLLKLSGGSLRNAIPREASAAIALPAGSKETLRRGAAEVQGEAAQENGEADCSIQVLDGGGGASSPAAVAEIAARGALTEADSQLLLTALGAAPHGVIAVEPDIPGLVRTSTNLATLATEAVPRGVKITVAFLSRSSSQIQLHEVVRRITSLGLLARAQVRSTNEYTGWKPNLASPLLAVCRRVYQDLFGAPPKVEGIHAGLECGIFSEKLEGLDMASTGAKVTGAHSPDERVYVASVQKVWRYLSQILLELSKG